MAASIICRIRAGEDVESHTIVDAASYPAAARAAAEWFRGALHPDEMTEITKLRDVPTEGYAVWEFKTKGRWES